MSADAIGTSLYIDYSDFANGIAEANRLIKLNEQQFKTAAAGLDDWSSTSEGLSAKLKSLSSIIELQKGKVSALESEYERVKAEKGENSKAAQTLALKLEKERTALASAEKDAQNYTKKLDELQGATDETTEANKSAGKSTQKLSKELEKNAEASDKAEKSAGGLGASFKSLLSANLAANAISALAGMVKNSVSAFMGMAEATKEYRANMAKVEQTARTMGESIDNTKENMLSMAAISGDVDAAGEAVNNLLSAGIKGDNLDKITKQLEGASIKWKDTLKLEGLADGLQETLATGAATGAFGELLERGGKSLDDFNARLASCTTEAEKQNLVMTELSDLGLEKISDSYIKNNKAMYDAELASLRYNDTMAQVGTAMEPINTLLTVMKTNMLQSFLPAIQNITKGLLGLATGAKGAGSQLVGGFVNVFQTVAQKVKTIGGEVIAAAVSIIPDMMSKLSAAFPVLIRLIADYIKLGLMTAANLFAGVNDKIPSFFTGIVKAFSDGFNSLLDSLPDFFSTFFETLGSYATMVTTFGAELLQGVGNAVANAITSIKSKLPAIVNSITNGIKSYLPKIVDGATKMFSGFLTALETTLKSLSKNLPSIIDTIIGAIKTWLPIIAENAFNLFMNIVKALIKFIPQLVKELPSIITAIVKGLLSLAGALLDLGAQLFNKIKDGITNNKDAMLEVGKNIVKGLWNGINNTTDWILSKIKGFGESVLDGIKDFFGIHSPSTAMAEIGDYCGQGFANGLVNSTPKAQQAGRVFSESAINEVKNDIANHEAELAQILGLEINNAAAQVDTESAGETIGNGIADGIKNSTKGIGKNVASGVASGVNSAKSKALDAMQGLIDSMASVDFQQDAEGIGWQIGSIVVDAISAALTAAYGAIGSLVGSLLKLIFSIIKGEATKEDVAKSVAGGVSTSSSSRGSARTKDYSVHYDDGTYSDISGAMTGINDAMQNDRNARNNQYIILNQTNNSPKALNAAEIYRNSNKAVNLLAAVV